MADLPHARHDICVASSNRMAGTALAEYLGISLRVPVAWHDLGPDPMPETAVFLAAHEPPEVIPRYLSTMRARGSRVVFVYDQALPHDELIEAALGFGVWSLCDAREDIEVLKNHVERARTGRRWEQDSTSEIWARKIDQARSGLSARESQVVQGFCGEPPLDPEEIADELGLSVNTVRVHLANVRRKLGDRYTGNREALRAALIDRGWLA